MLEQNEAHFLTKKLEWLANIIDKIVIIIIRIILE